ncbi:energy transducer TonB [Sulfurovum sp.]|uniref:energy transducer TonB n=1 Tax=Sulfurovum sp. TaxID=1969726 RepID=UPI0025D57E59|nr:energy transducer TonB [Sulfurovum sp.]
MRIKDQIVTVKPQAKVSPIIQLRHVVIKKPEPIPTVEPVKKEVHPEPPKPVVEEVAVLPKKIEKKAIQKVLKKKVLKKKRTRKKVAKKKVLKSVPRQKRSSPKQKAIKNHYLAKVRSTIEHRKKYPRSAKRLRQQGVVSIRFTIYKDGHIGAIALMKKSSYTKLNQAAINILKRIGAFAPIPKELAKSTLSLTVPIRYKILN